MFFVVELKRVIWISSIPLVIIFLLNLECNISGYFTIQNETTCFPNSYRFVMSGVSMRILRSVFFFCGIEFKNWMSSRMKLFLFYKNECRRISISLRSPLDGPATISLTLCSQRFGISMHSDFCVSTEIFISSDYGIFGIP